jgi:parallel beta-helix repeat protein
MFRKSFVHLTFASILLTLTFPFMPAGRTAHAMPLHIYIIPDGTSASWSRNLLSPSTMPPPIHIRANGTLDPANVSIQRSGNIYTFTGDVNAFSIIIEKSGITVDGNWHRLNGTGFIDGKDGFNLNSLSGVTIKRVKISNFYSGIKTYQSTNITLVENEITNNGYGIYVNSSNNSLILRNKVMHSEGGGLYIPNSFNITFEDNLIASNNYYAIGVQNTRNSTFVRNVIANNYGIGMRMSLSDNNTVYHNNFVNNTQNAFDMSSENNWDNGYPSGGNYWDNYNGTDHHSGPAQNLTGPDGIGDTPYVIDGNNADRYPHIRPLALGLLGDVNYDGVVNILDITIIASVYNHTEGEHQWIPQADLAPPYGIINMLDLVTCAAHYGETFPRNNI